MWLLLTLTLLAPAEQVTFNRDIRPILSDRCFTCHGPDAGNRQSGLRLDQEAAAKSELRGKYAIVAGDPNRSELMRRISNSNKALRMPPAYAGHEALSPAEIDRIRTWIQQGAQWQKHWSFLPPVRQPGRGSVDELVRARLKREGLTPAPEAAKLTLLRRVTLDLTGLPPTPQEADAFLADASPQAYEKVVDRLLASPRYAERMAMRWLEAARYADTNGYQSDGQRSMWRWRDWVIDAFHNNMPFDRFTVEQIAGDLLPNRTLSQRIATGFNRNHRSNAEGGIVEEEFRVEYVADRAETTATVWLGLTIGCARCHDHKYDPLTMRDYYRFFAYFNNTPDRGLVFNFGNEQPFIPAPTAEDARKLAGWTGRLNEAERQWASRKPRLEREQRTWEKSLAGAATVEWTVTAGLALHLPLDDASKSALELVDGKVGRATHFDGKRFVEAGLTAARFDYTDPFTLSAWIKPESPNGAIISRAEDYLEGEGYTWFLEQGRLRLYITRRFTDISLRIETEEPIRMGEWQHVAVTVDGSRAGAGVRMYVNGESRPLRILFDELTYPFGPKEPFRVGAGGGEKYRFRGAIDEVRAYSRALAAEEVASLSTLHSLNAIAAMPGKQRALALQHKLRLAFLDRFAPEDIRGAWRGLLETRAGWRKTYDSIPTVMVMVERPGLRETRILKRGAYDQPEERVTPGVPEALPPLPPGWPNNRLGLARWLVSPSNPLTARVTVNRLWQMLFGTALVKTAEDFGAQGEWPTHAELLDWLALEFIESGWNVKHILRTIVTSATYKQSSKVTPDLLRRDPDNRLLARGPRLRLSAESIRDQALAASGLLVEKTGGPSVKPYQPPGLWQELSGGSGYKADKGDGLYRRSLYTYWKRTVAPPSMITFDSPTRETCVVRETRTNTPLQALNLMNDVTYLEAARKMAERMMREGGVSPGERLAYGFRLLLTRPPTASEAAVLLRAWEPLRWKYERDREAAAKFLDQGESLRDRSLKLADLAAYAGVASLILNLDEAVTKE
jgi:hypothetical protein